MINLRQELIDLLESEGLGRIAYLRKATGKGKVTVGGEYDKSNELASEGRPYLDYEVRIYRTVVYSTQEKGPGGRTEPYGVIIYLAASTSVPAPTQNDKIVEIQYSIDGAPVEPHLPTQIIPINAVVDFWGDNDRAMVYYTISPGSNRTNQAGRLT